MCILVNTLFILLNYTKGPWRLVLKSEAFTSALRLGEQNRGSELCGVGEKGPRKLNKVIWSTRCRSSIYNSYRGTIGIYMLHF